jgi:biopolymer transport protein ExbB/TolQ
MIIKRLKIAIGVGIFSILLTFFSVYRFVSNDKIISFYESLIGKNSKCSVEALRSNKNESESSDNEEKKKKEKEEEEEKRIKGSGAKG